MSVPYAAFPKYGPSVLGQAKYDAEMAAWQAYIDSTKHRRPEGDQELPDDHHENLDTYTYLRKYVKPGQTRKRIFREQNLKAQDVEDALQQGRDAMTAELGERGEGGWSPVPGTEKAVKPRGKAFEEGEDERRNEEGHNGSDGEAEADEGQGEGQDDAEGEDESDDDAEGEGEGDDEDEDEDSEADADSEGDEGDGESQDEDDTPRMPTCPECGEQRGTTEGCCKVEPPEDMPTPDVPPPEEPNLQLLRIDGEAPYAGPEASKKLFRMSHSETVSTLTKSLADVDQWTRHFVAHANQEASTELYEALTASHIALKARIAKGGGGGVDMSAVGKEIRSHIKVYLENREADAPKVDVDEIVAKVLEKIDAPRRIEVSMNGQVREIEGTPHKVFDEAIECLGMDMPLLLVGPAGSGKGFLAQHLADGMGVRFGFSSCSEGMSEGMLLGRGVPLAEKFLYLQSSFVDFYENGGLFLLDEIDAANPNVILILNECLSSPHLSIPNRMDKPYAEKHEDFYFACNANTWGTGPNMEYVGRNRLDSAFLDRFIGSTIELEYDNRVEGEIAKSYLGADEARDVLKRYWGIRKKLTEMNIRRIWSTRGLEKMCRALAAGKEMGVLLDRHTRGWTQDEKNKAGV